MLLWATATIRLRLSLTVEWARVTNVEILEVRKALFLLSFMISGEPWCVFIRALGLLVDVVIKANVFCNRR